MIPNKFMKKYILALLFSVFLLLASACARQSSTVYENESANIKFNLPDDWQILDESSQMFLSPNEQLLNDAPFTSGIRLIFVALPKSTFTVVDIESLLQSNIQPFLNTSDAQVVQSQDEKVIDGKRALFTAVSGTNIIGTPTIWHSTVIEGETNVVLAFIEASQDHEDEIERAEEIISSIEFLVIFQ